MLKSYYKNDNINFVNRIDKETSGLVIASKNIEYTRKLTEIIRERNINKYYYTLVKGVPTSKEFKVELQLNNNGQNVEVVNNGGKKSLTYFTLVEVDEKNSISLLRAKLETGRKHQIRVHLKHIGLPILGDNKYGIKDGNEMFLNSYKIDVDEINLHIDMGVPKSFKERLNLRNLYKKLK
jgi:23S rRNA pseudouridine955/2504/2580 synthase